MSHQWDDLRRRMSTAAQTRVDQRAREELAAMPIAEIRQAVAMPRQELGDRRSPEIENAADMYLTTLRRFVEALGGAGETVSRASELGPALRRAFDSGVPYLVNVLTDPADQYPRSSNLA